VADRIVVNDQIVIDRGEVAFGFSRSPGPGGQNVNKVNTKATLHWPFWGSDAIDWRVKQRLARLSAKRINDSGELVISSSRFRSQKQNIDDCIEKLRGLVQAAATQPKLRKATRPSRAVIRQRAEQKRAHSRKKQMRRPPGLDADG
jgi:ribosome-associated protein